MVEHYQNKTFCHYWQDCETPCNKSLTEHILYKGMEAGKPIKKFDRKPSCFIPVDETQKMLQEKLELERLEQIDDCPFYREDE